MPWNLLSMGAQRQRAAAAWRRAGARGADRGATAVCAVSGRRGPHSTSGRLGVVESAALRRLAGPPGLTVELCGS